MCCEVVDAEDITTTNYSFCGVSFRLPLVISSRNECPSYVSFNVIKFLQSVCEPKDSKRV